MQLTTSEWTTVVRALLIAANDCEDTAKRIDDYKIAKAFQESAESYRRLADRIHDEEGV